MPNQFLVDHDHMEAVMKPIAQELDIPILRVPGLPAYLEALEGMREIMLQ